MIRSREYLHAWVTSHAHPPKAVSIVFQYHPRIFQKRTYSKAECCISAFRTEINSSCPPTFTSEHYKIRNISNKLSVGKFHGHLRVVAPRPVRLLEVGGHAGCKCQLIVGRLAAVEFFPFACESDEVVTLLKLE